MGWQIAADKLDRVPVAAGRVGRIETPAEGGLEENDLE